MPEPNKILTLAEVATHNDKNSAWVVIHDKVYDVTKFLEEHPGGEEVLLEVVGKDATEPFEDVGHSTDARSLMDEYLVGELSEEDKVQTKKVKPQTWGVNESASDATEGGSWSSWIVPVAFGLAATVLYRYYLHATAAATGTK